MIYVYLLFGYNLYLIHSTQVFRNKGTYCVFNITWEHIVIELKTFNLYRSRRKQFYCHMNIIDTI